MRTGLSGVYRSIFALRIYLAVNRTLNTHLIKLALVNAIIEKTFIILLTAGCVKMYILPQEKLDLQCQGYLLTCCNVK